MSSSAAGSKFPRLLRGKASENTDLPEEDDESTRGGAGNAAVTFLRKSKALKKEMTALIASTSLKSFVTVKLLALRESLDGEQRDKLKKHGDVLGLCENPKLLLSSI